MNYTPKSPELSWFAEGQEYGHSEVAVVGGKGANLIAMHQKGLNVPDGFCLTTEAYREAVSPILSELLELADRGEAEQAHGLILRQSVPDETRAAIQDAYQALGGPAVAVRSSATTEDLESASFAGQQDTFLGVHDGDALIYAVVECWASLWSERAIAYREKAGFSHEAAELAVVVQEIVDADVAGVLFTADPVSGNEEQMLVSASYGLGESVVGALVAPDTFTVDLQGSLLNEEIGSKETRVDLDPDGGTRTFQVPVNDRNRPCLTSAELKALVELGTRVSASYETPQDIEWAISHGNLYLLQTRPITTLLRKEAGHGPAKSRVVQIMRDDLIEHYPAPFPLDVMPVRKVQTEIQKVLGSFGVSTPPVAEVIQMNDDGVVSVHASFPKVTPRVLVDVPRRVKRALRDSMPNWESDHSLWQSRLEQFRTETEELKAVSANKLIGYSDQAINAAADLTRERFVNYLLPFMLKRITADVLMKISRIGKDASTEDLFRDLDFMTSIVDRRIERLRGRARELGLIDVLTAEDLDVSRLNGSSLGAEFWSEATDALTTIGARTPRMYLPYSSRSWSESPDDFLALLVAGLGQDQTRSGRRVDARAEVRHRLPRPLRRRWDHIVSDLRHLHIGREGSLYLIETWFVEARRVMQEIADRLVYKGVLNSPSDIVFTTFEEVESALSEHARIDLKRKVARRKQMRGSAEAAWWDRGEIASGGTQIRGVAASPGRTSGSARVIHGPSDFSMLQAGEILVCKYTDPTWTPLFSLAAAVVADTGGPLSHAAIVAREYGIPAVLGTQIGTRDIATGQSLTVDGSKGNVTITKNETHP